MAERGSAEVVDLMPQADARRRAGRGARCLIRRVTDEETDGRGLPPGNFPQALIHLAFISAAYFLDRQLDPAYRPIWQP